MDTGVIPALRKGAKFGFIPSHAGWRHPLCSTEVEKNQNCLPVTLSSQCWWQRNPRVIMVLVTSSADSGWSTVFIPLRHFRWQKLFWKSCKSLWAKTWYRAHNHCRARWLSEIEGDGEKVCVWGAPNTGGNYIIFAYGTSLPPLQLAQGNHLLPIFQRFAIFTVPKQGFISVLCLCTLNPGCVRQKECGAGGKNV